jgi:hypothetical protein
MARSRAEVGRVPLYGAGGAWRTGYGETWWSQGREATMNWLALGVLLAAWNASDNDTATQVQRRPEALRGYAHVSVRAQRSASTI